MKRRSAITARPDKAVSAAGLVRRRSRGALPAGTVVPLRQDDFVTAMTKGGYLPNLFRYGDRWHVSDIIGKCPRMIALAHRTDTPLTGETLYDGSEVTFAMGRAGQQALTDKLARTQPSRLYGDWVCACEHSRQRGTATQAQKQPPCVRCRKPLNRYREIELTHAEMRLTGAVDLTFLVDGAFYLTEVKSIGREDWKDMVRPLPDHTIQGLFYWWLAREQGWPLYDQISVMYLPKTHVFKSPYKEFVLTPSEQLYRLEEYLADVRSLNAAVAGGAYPARVCPAPNSPQAKKCELCALCFGMRD